MKTYYGAELPVLIEREAGWTPERFWTLWGREESISLPRVKWSEQFQSSYKSKFDCRDD
jgi:hypothetical protein